MTTKTRSIALATLLATTISGAAMADISVDTGSSLGVDVGSSSVSSEGGLSLGASDEGLNVDLSGTTTAGTEEGGNVTADAGADASTDEAGADAGLMLSGLIDADGVNATTVTELMASGEIDESGLDAAVDANASAIAEMQDAIAANAELSAALEAEGYAAEDVIGAQAMADGSTRLVIDDRG
ncbi:hypothetical protein [Oceanicola sp. S124]|uniref:hypothetical protein n=1 Tax=Oceanicola sp. S124 TaxID=1042378 RepID=UPI0002559670|nr:hypothetical protein [Oceanicola sp. S124]